MWIAQLIAIHYSFYYYISNFLYTKKFIFRKNIICIEVDILGKYIFKKEMLQIFMKLFKSVLYDIYETYRNIFLVRETLSIPCHYHQAQFPPPLTRMNRVQQAFLFPIHCLANAIILFNSYHGLC
jgi:hypothetical protein